MREKKSENKKVRENESERTRDREKVNQIYIEKETRSEVEKIQREVAREKKDGKRRSLKGLEKGDSKDNKTI